MAFGFVAERRFERDLPEPECNSYGFEIIMYKIFIHDKDIMLKSERVILKGCFRIHALSTLDPLRTPPLILAGYSSAKPGPRYG